MIPKLDIIGSVKKYFAEMNKEFDDADAHKKEAHRLYDILDKVLDGDREKFNKRTVTFKAIDRRHGAALYEINNFEGKKVLLFFADDYLIIAPEPEE
jgi:hypothetical protein